MSEWQPIETAPEDCWVLAHTSRGFRFVRWQEDAVGKPRFVTQQNWIGAFAALAETDDAKITHWMPLPEPPDCGVAGRQNEHP